MNIQITDAFGIVLKQILDQKRVTQAQLAERARTSQPSVSAICRGRVQCGPRLAGRFADALGLDDTERAHFIAAAKRPGWKGFSDPVHGAEAMLSDAVLKRLALDGIRGSTIASVVYASSPSRTREGLAPDIVLVLKDGRVFQVEMKIAEKR